LLSTDCNDSPEAEDRANRGVLADETAVMETRAVLREGPAGAVLAISGPLNVETAAAARRQIQTELAAVRAATIEIDASGVDHGDMSGMSLLYELTEGRLAPGVRAGVTGLKPEFARLLSIGSAVKLRGVAVLRPGINR
jgi:ABC-type transporter Mla MlaB component